MWLDRNWSPRAHALLHSIDVASWLSVLGGLCSIPLAGGTEASRLISEIWKGLVVLDMINAFVELAAGIVALVVALLLFFKRDEYARRTKVRLDRLPKRVGETTALDSTPRTFALVSIFLVVLCVGLIVDATRRLLMG
jgi:hypothetical protein